MKMPFFQNETKIGGVISLQVKVHRQNKTCLRDIISYSFFYIFLLSEFKTRFQGEIAMLSCVQLPILLKTLFFNLRGHI